MKQLLFLSLLFVSLSTFAQKMTKDGKIVAKIVAENQEKAAHTAPGGPTFKIADDVPDSVIFLTPYQEKELLNYSKIIEQAQIDQKKLLDFIYDAAHKSDYELRGYLPGKLIVKKKQ